MTAGPDSVKRRLPSPIFGPFSPDGKLWPLGCRRGPRVASQAIANLAAPGYRRLGLSRPLVRETLTDIALGGVDCSSLGLRCNEAAQTGSTVGSTKGNELRPFRYRIQKGNNSSRVISCFAPRGTTS